MAEGGAAALFRGWSEQKEAVVGGVEFRFARLLAMDAFDVIEDIRVALNGQAVAHAMANMDVEGGVGISHVAQLLAALPRLIGKDELADVRRKLFAHVEFRVGGSSWAPVVTAQLDDQPRAFAEAGPLAVYEVLGRALAYNFFALFSGALSRLGAATLDSIPGGIRT